MSGMTQKHYKLLAQAFANCRPEVTWGASWKKEWAGWEIVIEHMQRKLKQDNPRFDEDRFMKACRELPSE